MLGLFELQVPAALATRLQAVGGRGVLGLLLMGMVSGLVASPCVAAPLAGILTFVAVTGNAVTGFLLLFAFSWGMGLLLIVAGTSAGALKALPKSGEWMVGVKHLFGFVLLGAAAYFVRTLLPELVYYLVQAALLIAAGVALGALESLPPSPGAILRAKRALAIVLVVLGCYVTVGTLHARGILLPRPLAPAAVAPAASPPAEIRWQSDIKQAFALAQRERRLVLLDFRADWCAACLEMEERVYPDPRVVQAVSRFVPLRVDMTDAGKEAEALGEKYQVAGLPAVVIARPTGELVTSVLGALETGDLLEFLRKVDAPTAGPSTGGPTSPQNRR
jgi:thiol:disulfide interchange protein DsbD